MIESVGEPCTFHDLRHTHAALLIAQGEHPKVIQSRLGHASIKTTLDTYGHLFDGLDEAAADRLDEVWQASEQAIASHSGRRRLGFGSLSQMPRDTANAARKAVRR